jgi:hypothetical protein
MAKKDELNTLERNAVRAAALENEREEVKAAQEEGETLNPAVDENPDPRPAFVKDMTEEEVEQGATDVAPEEGIEGQAPVLTPGVYAAISSKLLPNAQRDAEILIAERLKKEGEFEVQAQESFRADRGNGETSTGARDAYDLAKLLEQYPGWVNGLDRLDDLERGVGVKNPAPWVKNPVDLLEEAKRHNMYFVGANGNFLR